MYTNFTQIVFCVTSEVNRINCKVDRVELKVNQVQGHTPPPKPSYLDLLPTFYPGAHIAVCETRGTLKPTKREIQVLI